MDNPDASREPKEGNDVDFQFSGGNELSYEEFLKRIRRISFENGKSRDSAWIADLASLHLSGNAAKWFENLDDTTQQDWSLLKREFLKKYGDQPTDESGPSPPLANDPLLPARIPIASWSSPVMSSAIRFPNSKDDWLREARERKSKFSGKRGLVYWHLVEPSEWVPDNLIPISLESGVTMYSIRAWHGESLALGKLAITGPFYLTKRAWIYWFGKEIQWNGHFEVLVGERQAVRWITPQATSRFTAVEGGVEGTGNRAMLVALCDVKKFTQPGKVFSSESKAYYGWGGKEYSEQNFSVLAWAD